MFHTDGIQHTDYFFCLVHVIIKLGNFVHFCHVIDPFGKQRSIIALLSCLDQFLQPIQPDKQCKRAIKVILQRIFVHVTTIMISAFFTRKNSSKRIKKKLHVFFVSLIHGTCNAFHGPPEMRTPYIR